MDKVRKRMAKEVGTRETRVGKPRETATEADGRGCEVKTEEKKEAQQSPLAHHRINSTSSFGEVPSSFYEPWKIRTEKETEWTHWSQSVLEVSILPYSTGEHSMRVGDATLETRVRDCGEA
jgi:hypothetical protein